MIKQEYQKSYPKIAKDVLSFEISRIKVLPMFAMQAKPLGLEIALFNPAFTTLVCALP